MNKISMVLLLVCLCPYLIFSQSLWNQNGTKIYYNGGNVGINLTNPQSALHVSNGTSGQTPHSFSDLTIEDDTQGMVTILTPNNQNAYFGFGDTDDNFVGGIQYDHTNDIMYLRVNDHTSDMVINKHGYVAIGKTTPTVDLDVEGSIRSSDGNDNVTLRSVNAESHSEIVWGDDTDDRFRFYYNYWDGTANDKEVMTLLPSGNVGIGTTSPDSKLAVNGNIHAKEVKVDLVG